MSTNVLMSYLSTTVDLATLYVTTPGKGTQYFLLIVKDDLIGKDILSVGADFCYDTPISFDLKS